METLKNDDRRARFTTFLGDESLAERLTPMPDEPEVEEPVEPKVTRKVVEVTDASGSRMFIALKAITAISLVTNTMRDFVGLELHVGGKSFAKTPLTNEDGNAILKDWQAAL